MLRIFMEYKYVIAIVFLYHINACLSCFSTLKKPSVIPSSTEIIVKELPEFNIINIVCKIKNQINGDVLELVEEFGNGTTNKIFYSSSDFLFGYQRKNVNTTVFCRIINVSNKEAISNKIYIKGIYNDTTLPELTSITENNELTETTTVLEENKAATFLSTTQKYTEENITASEDINEVNDKLSVPETGSNTITIISGVVGFIVVILLLILVGAIYTCVKRKSKDKTDESRVQYIELDLLTSSSSRTLDKEPPYAEIIGVVTKKKK